MRSIVSSFKLVSPSLSAQINWWISSVGRRKLSTQCHPVDRNCFKRAADTPWKARKAFTQDFPLNMPFSPPYISSAESFIRFAIHAQNDCIMCIPPGWTITLSNCSGWFQHTCFVTMKSCMSLET